MPTEQSLENSLIVDPIKGSAEINLQDPSLLCTLQYSAVYGTCTKVHHRYPCQNDMGADQPYQMTRITAYHPYQQAVAITNSNQVCLQK